ncbi:SusC/RagA family TonB-linked outer membrane protein [Winogradskyella luteola]|uniref:TonB-dependent receptor n=1 Tax=Winogradskyella luteola TaxID=2828330 RepID=A0A9X1FB46_9FLAO|nr:TonB-dependent receptor [Winogradskyella luteola]MBV7270600.1 TonB-dependent receptor [Winogradskyella luteola]
MKLKLTWLLTLFMAFVMQFSFAQEKTVTGTITTAEDGLPLPGASVIVKGTARGQQTDFDGKYSISVNTGDVLQISYVGMKTTEVTVGASNTYDVALKSDNALEEVVVVAYGTQKKEAIVGAVSTLTSENIENQQVTSPLRALQGTVAGVNLLTSGGQPGNNPTIRIRGFSSINAAQGPLIILDGAPFNGNLNTISQDQIESLTVLKDASSTSLYGSRGANGVIVITTKKGRLNTKAKVTLRTQYGVSNPAVGLHDLVGTEDNLRLSWQAIRNNNIALGQSAADAATNASTSLIGNFGYNPYNVPNPIDSNGNLVDGAQLLWETDWEDLLIRSDVPRVNHNLSITGGGESSSYFFSVDYLSEDGPVIESDFERIATRLNVQSQVNDWLQVGINTSFSRSRSGNPDQTSGSTTQAIQWIYSVSSIFPVYARDADGNIVLNSSGNRFFDAGNGNGGRLGQAFNATRNINGGENILASLLLGDETRIRTNFVGTAFAEAKFLKNFTFNSRFNYENFMFDSHSFNDDIIGAASTVGGRVSKTRNVTTTVNATQALNYTNSFGNHNISVDAIMEAYELTTDGLRTSATGFLPGQEELGNGTNPETFGGIRISQRINGYLGRLAYNYDNKYFVEGSIRRDGSSQFGSDFRWGTFYSVGASWVLTNETFMENVDWLDNFKIRASYGELGNNAGIGNFPYQFVFQGANPNNIVLSPVEGNPSLLPPTSLPDPNLVWEKTASTNIGIDFNIFRGAFSGSVDYYNKESIDLLYNVPAANSTGVVDVFTNNGAVRNYGWEFSLNSQIFNTDDFSWSVGANFSLDENEITELPQEQFINGTKLWKEGNSLFEFYMREWAGVDPSNGAALWYIDVTDTNGDVIGRDVTSNYDQATLYETEKTSLPDIQGGFNTNLRYKQFDLSVLFNFSFGAYLYDSDYSGLINGFASLGSGAHPDNFKAWQQPGDITDFAVLTTGQNNANDRSTRFLFKNDYVRLKALTLGYNFSEKALEDIGISRIRLFLQADNLFTWQSHMGIDPEQNFAGTTNARSPLQRTITTGAIIEF